MHYQEWILNPKFKQTHNTTFDLNILYFVGIKQFQKSSVHGQGTNVEANCDWRMSQTLQKSAKDETSRLFEQQLAISCTFKPFFFNIRPHLNSAFLTLKFQVCFGEPMTP